MTELHPYIKQVYDSIAAQSLSVTDAVKAQEILDIFNMSFLNKARTNLSPSSLGRPSCQLQYEKLGVPKELPEVPANTKFLAGHITEAVAIPIMMQAGLPIDSVHPTVEITIGDRKVTGTADIVIGGKVYDIKTASDKAFKWKFKQGYNKILSSDTFGYVAQLVLYAIGLGVPPGGWIAINKETGEWWLTEFEDDMSVIGPYILKQSEHVLKLLDDTYSVSDVIRKFDTIEETHYQALTGKKILPFACAYCPFKHTCWGNIRLDTNPLSTAREKTPRWELVE